MVWFGSVWSYSSWSCWGVVVLSGFGEGSTLVQSTVEVVVRFSSLPCTVGIASRCSGVVRRQKRHHSKGGGRNAVGSNAIAMAMARGSWQRQLGILL